MEASGLTEAQIKYARRKADQPSLHPGKHGGARRQAYDPEERERLHQAIWETITKNPRFQLHQIVDAVDFEVNYQYVHKVSFFPHFSNNKGAQILEVLFEGGQPQTLDKVLCQKHCRLSAVPGGDQKDSVVAAQVL